MRIRTAPLAFAISATPCLAQAAPGSGRAETGLRAAVPASRAETLAERRQACLKHETLRAERGARRDAPLRRRHRDSSIRRTGNRFDERWDDVCQARQHELTQEVRLCCWA